jgi:cardiolipin synthase (CMP-forming)
MRRTAFSRRFRARILDRPSPPVIDLEESGGRMTIPNIITIFRLVLIPIVIVMILQKEWGLAFALFAIAGISDGLDGWIARRFDMRSEFGAVIDPLADKALLVSIFITLAVVDKIPAWLAVIVVSRDVAIVMAFMVSWVMARPMAVKPLFVSKANTAVQIAFAAFVLGALAFAFDPGVLVDLFTILIVMLTIVTAGAYLVRWMRHMTQ